MNGKSEEYRLTPEQLQFWDENGYLVIPNFITEADAEALKRRAAELVDGFEPVGTPVLLDCPEYELYFLDCGDKIHYFVEPEALDKQGNLLRPRYLAMGKIGRGVHLLDPVFREFSNRPRHFLIARALGTHTPALLQSQYIFKQPGIGQKFNLHQDASYMVTEPPSVVGLWLALESAAEYNGCLRVLPGHHRGPLLARFKRQKDGGAEMERIVDFDWDKKNLLSIAVPARSAIFLHGLLPHCSNKNSSKNSRQAYVMHFIDRHAAYPTYNWLPAPIPVG